VIFFKNEESRFNRRGRKGFRKVGEGFKVINTKESSFSFFSFFFLCVLCAFLWVLCG
jgi:hypothetical protein